MKISRNITPTAIRRNSNKDTKELIKEFYDKGVSSYRAGDQLLAKEYFVKIMKPIFSKPELRDPDISIEDVKEIILNSMYFLARIYNENNNYIEAVSLFQYCNNFSINYKIISDIDFLQNAHVVEHNFLKSLGLNTDNYLDSVAKTSQHNENLLTLRTEIQKARNDLDSKPLERRAESVEDIYKTCTSFFVDLLQKLIHDSMLQLGPMPEDCNYAVVGLGSISGGKITPYSDIEFAFLINENVEEYKQYFRNLTKLLNIKVTNLGKTPLYMVGIEALNNVKTLKSEDDWFFLDNVTKAGFCFDSLRAYACKTPLGRKGYLGKDDFELICTPEQMLEFQLEKPLSPLEYAKNWFESDPHLVYGLRHLLFVDGNKKLLTKYREGLFDIVSSEIVQARSLSIIKENIKNIGLKLGEDYDGVELHIKKDLYRIIDTTVGLLSDYYAITLCTKRFGNTTSWEAIDQLEQLDYLNAEGAMHLREAISISAELRLEAYSNHEAQVDNLFLRAKSPSKNNSTDFLLKLSGIQLLEHFYRIVLPLQKIISDFLAGEQPADLNLSQETFYDKSPYVTAMFNARMLKYRMALKGERKIDLIDLNQPELENLFSLCFKIGDYTKITEISEKYCRLTQHNSSALNKMGLVKLALADYAEASKYFYEGLKVATSANQALQKANSYVNIITYFSKRIIANNNDPERDYLIKNIKEYYEKSVKIYSLLSDKLSLSKLYDIMGEFYLHVEEEHELSTSLFEQSLRLKDSLYSKITYSIETAKSYKYLALASYAQGDVNTALHYIQENLLIQKTAYLDFELSPYISTVLAFAVKIHLDKGEYESALKYCQNLMDVYTYRNHNKLHNDLTEMKASYKLLELAFREENMWNEAVEKFVKISLICANVQNKLDYFLPKLSRAIQESDLLKVEEIVDSYDQSIGLYTVDENLLEFLRPILEEPLPNYNVTPVQLAAFGGFEIEWLE